MGSTSIEIDPESQRRKMAVVKVMLGVVLSVYEWQTRRRRYFVRHFGNWIGR